MVVSHLIELVDGQPYYLLTVNLALRNVAKQLGLCYATHEEMPECNYDSLVVFSAANLRSGLTTAELRRQYPNGKLVCISGDAIYFRHRGIDEFDSPLEVDLFLDLLDGMVEYYRGSGVNADAWMWTASETVVNDFMKRNRPKTQNVDFIGLFSKRLPYRHQLWKTIQDGGFSFINRPNTGRTKMVVGFGLDELYVAYSKCRFTLGTTSSSERRLSKATFLRSMKGFRDWLGPACGNVLIYDNHPDIIKKYPCPLYDYDKPETIFGLIKNIDYAKVLTEQQDWLLDNTLEKQFLRLFKKHSLI